MSFLLTFLVSLCTLASLPALATEKQPKQHRKLLIISDIDDTLRPTHVRSTSDAVLNAYRMTPFKGMARLYTQLICHDLLTPDERAACIISRGRSLRGTSKENLVYYVTGFPQLSTIQKFLRYNHFPLNGGIRSKPFYEDTLDFKIEKHEEIIRRFPNHHIIVIGDNGQKDRSVYAHLKRKYRHISIFVRQLYADKTPVHSQYIPFISYFDLANHLLALGFLQADDVHSLALLNGNGPNEGFGTNHLVDWENCTSFFRWFSRLGKSDYYYQEPGHLWHETPALLAGLIENFEEFLAHRCR